MATNPLRFYRFYFNAEPGKLPTSEVGSGLNELDAFEKLGYPASGYCKSYIHAVEITEEEYNNERK